MRHPLGYDPDPAARGEGSSTGRRRRDDSAAAADAPPTKRRSRRYDADDEDEYRPPGMPTPPATRPATPSPAPTTPSTPLKVVLRLPALAALSRPASPAPSLSPITQLPVIPSPTHPRPVVPRIRLLVGGGRPRKGGKRAGSADVVPRASRAQRTTRSRRTSATPTTLESIAAESAAIKAEVTRLGLVLRDVNADGNCLFRALGDQVWGEQGRHAEVRALVCNYLDSARGELGDFVAGFLNEGEDYADYVARMRGMGVYGSHIELLAATKVFRRSIRIILAQTSYTVEYVEGEAAAVAASGEVVSTAASKRKARRTKKAGGAEPTPTDESKPDPPAPDAVPQPTESAAPAPTGTPIPPPQPGCSLIWLALFADAEHYESVRKGGAGGPANVPDSLAVPHARDVSEAARRERGEVIEGDVKNKDKAAAKADSRLAQVLASFPAGHGVSSSRASGVLARTKGDVGAAVEILLEDLAAEAEADESDTTAATSVRSASTAEGDSMRDASDAPERRITRSRSSLASGSASTNSTSSGPKVDVNAYRDRAASPSSSEASEPSPPSSPSSPSTPPTSPLSHASEIDDKPSGPLTRAARGRAARGRGRGRGPVRGRGRTSKM